MSALRASYGAHAAAVRDAEARLLGMRFAPRLAAKDDALWSDDAAHRAVAANRLGWLDAPAAMRARAGELAAFAGAAAAEGFTHAVLLGMGGSSLAPEVLARTFGFAPGRLALTVLDNTSPAAVRAVTAAHDPRRTLFVVSSKSGGTIEVASFEKHFHAWVAAARGAAAGRSFVAITDPGTSLEALARTRGYRATFTNPPDIGGRYSALSCFGLVPGALIGADVAGLCDGAAPERDALAADGGEAVRLGAALGGLALAGRDKLTLVFPPPLASFGSWVEQLIAESTGKQGRGVVPVAGEALAGPSRYGDDRVFVAVGAPALPPDDVRMLDALEAAGHPVIRWERASPGAMGADFMRWEIATAAAGAVLGVDPFDEPNVAEAKAATQVVLQRALDGERVEPEPAAREGELAAFAPPGAPAPGTDPATWLPSLLAQAKPGDYVAVLAYMARTDGRDAALSAIRHGVRDASRLATTLGYGPRFLHSTGQLHKGGPNTGVFLQLTCDEGELAIPGERYGFGTLRAAQAAGDFEVLARRGRRVLRVHLGSGIEDGLERLSRALAGARA